MFLDHIMSMASRGVRLQFLVMERSLRATGCTLPLQVIPYGDDLFDLPDGAAWTLNIEMADWLKSENAHPTMRKYQCLTEAAYHFTDTDVVFLQNPEKSLAAHSGFITTCTEWNKPQWTYTEEARILLSRKTSTWQRKVFSTGQFACDRALYTAQELMDAASQPAFAGTCLRYPFHEQPGINLLVNTAEVEVTNLTLPPYCMESSWAGDYPGDYEPLWQDPERKPYLIHWAGPTLEWPLPINQIFYDFLTRAEKAEWDEQQKLQIQKRSRTYERSLPVHRRVARKLLGRSLA